MAFAKTVDRFTEAYLEFYPLVYSAVYKKVGNKDDAADICQEIFMIFMEKFDEIENRRNWLLGTLRNVVYRYYQRKATKSTEDIDEMFNDIGLTFVNGFRDTRILISEAMENVECSEKERVMLDLIATHNFTYVAVAEIMGLTRRQVQYQYDQVVARIMDYLGKKGIKNLEDLL